MARAEFFLADVLLANLLLSMDGRTRVRLEGLPASASVVGFRRAGNGVNATVITLESGELTGEAGPTLIIPTVIVEAPRAVFSGAVEGARQRLNRDYPWTSEDAELWHVLSAATEAESKLQAAQEELATLRRIFSLDYLVDAPEAFRLAYEQGWRECRNQADLRIEKVDTDCVLGPPEY